MVAGLGKVRNRLAAIIAVSLSEKKADSASNTTSVRDSADRGVSSTALRASEYHFGNEPAADIGEDQQGKPSQRPAQCTLAAPAPGMAADQ